MDAQTILTLPDIMDCTRYQARDNYRTIIAFHSDYRFPPSPPVRARVRARDHAAHDHCCCCCCSWTSTTTCRFSSTGCASWRCRTLSWRNRGCTTCLAPDRTRSSRSSRSLSSPSRVRGHLQICFCRSAAPAAATACCTLLLRVFYPQHTLKSANNAQNFSKSQ